MGASLTLTREDEPTPETVRAFEDGLNGYNAQFYTGADWSPRWFIGRDAAGAVCSGARFIFEMDWTFIHWLWIAEPFRRRGEGKRLVRAVEDEARARGMRGVYLDTFGFQAPLFYPKLGYSEFGRIKNFAGGYDRLWFQKIF